MFSTSNNLHTADPALASMIDAEVVRQHQHIELIASENYTSPAVMEAHHFSIYHDGECWVGGV